MKYIRFTLSLVVFMLLLNISNAEKNILCNNNILESGKTYKINDSEISVKKSSGSNTKEKPE